MATSLTALGKEAPIVISAASASALLAHKQWKHRDLIAQFLSPDYDEASYLATTMAQSSSASLEQLTSLLGEISAEIHEVVVKHHSSLLTINSHILLIEGEVQLVVRRVSSLKASLARIQSTLLQPYTRLASAVAQLHAVQTTSEYIRQAIRVLNFCDKLRTHIAPPPAAGPRGVAPLRGLVKAASLLYEVHEVFSCINLNGIAAVDAQLPFLNATSELLHNQGRKILGEAMAGISSATDGGTSTAVAQLGQSQVNQVDLDYVVQLFYNMAPNPGAATQLQLLTRQQRRIGGSRRTDSTSDQRGGGGAAAAALEEDDGVDLNSGTELVLVLDELVTSYLEQLRSALKKILDIASSTSSAGPAALHSSADAKKAVLQAAKEKLSGGGGGRNAAKQAQASQTASLRSTLWDRLDSFTDLLFLLTTHIYTLSRILHEKRDLVWNPTPGVSFGEVWRLQREVVERKRERKAQQEGAALKGAKSAGGARQRSSSPLAMAGPSDEDQTLLHYFWSAVCTLLREEFEPIAATSASSAGTPAAGSSAHAPHPHPSHNFLRTIFVNEYPRLHGLWEKAVWERVEKWGEGARVTGVAMTPATALLQSAQQSDPPPMLNQAHRHVLLISFLPFFQLYLSRTLTQLTEPLTLMFTSHESLHTHLATVPSKSDVQAFVSVVQTVLDAAADDVRDQEVKGHVTKAVGKAVMLFAQHCERMLVTEADREIFAAGHLSAAAQSEALPTAKHPSLSHSLSSAHTALLSASQRTNLDLLAILCQVEKEITEAELNRRYPMLLGTQTTAAAPPMTSTTTEAQGTSVQQTVMKKAWLAVRGVQEQILSILLQSVSGALLTTLCGIIPETDLSAAAATAAPSSSSVSPSAAEKLLASTDIPPADGSPAMQGFRRRMAYCVGTLFPLYTHLLQGGSNTSTGGSASATNTLAPVDAQSRQQMWSEKFLHPLNLKLIQTFVHLLPLHPLALSSAPIVVHENFRSHLLNELTLFEAQMQMLVKQPKKRLAARLLLGGGGGASGDSSDLSPIDSLSGLKQLLFAKDLAEYGHLYTTRSVDAVTLLHFLFTNASLTASAQPPPGAIALAHTAPQRLLMMKVEDYARWIENHNLVEIFELFSTKIYAALESRIPNIPAGAAGRLFVQETYPKVALAHKILTKQSNASGAK